MNAHPWLLLLAACGGVPTPVSRDAADVEDEPGTVLPPDRPGERPDPATPGATGACLDVVTTTPRPGGLDGPVAGPWTVQLDGAPDPSGGVFVHGEQSGARVVTLTAAGNTLGIGVDRPFFAGERVSVTLSAGLRAADGRPLCAPQVWRARARTLPASGFQGWEILSDPALGGAVGVPHVVDFDLDGYDDAVFPGGDIRFGGPEGSRRFDVTGTGLLSERAAVGFLDDDLFPDVLAEGGVGWGRGRAGWVVDPVHTIDFDRDPVLGDVNGDGIDDLVLSLLTIDDGDAIYRVWVAEGLGAGRFAWGAHSTLLATGERQAVLRDLDGDGDLDVLTLLRGDLPGIGRHLQEPDGSLTSVVVQVDPVPGSDTFATGVGDLDGDGQLDLVGYVSSRNTDVWVAWGDELGGLDGGVTRLTAPRAPLRAVGDLNGDGLDDVYAMNDPLTGYGTPLDAPHHVLGRADRALTVVSHRGWGDTYLRPWDPEGDGPGRMIAAGGRIGPADADGPAFLEAVEGVDLHAFTPDVSPAADLDGDGRLDLISVDDVVTLVLAPLTPDERRVELSGSSGARGVAPVDLDGDGVLDLVVGRLGTGLADPTSDERLEVWWGVGDGTFTQGASVITSPFVVRDLRVGDLDADGDPDLVTSGLILGSYSTDTLLRTYTLEADALVAGRTHDVGIEAKDFELGDFDGDGVLDLAHASEVNGGRVRIVFGPLLTTPSATVSQLASENPLAAGLGVGDLDGDGLDDLVLVRPFRDETPEILLGSATRTLGAGGHLPGSIVPLSSLGGVNWYRDGSGCNVVDCDDARVHIGDFDGDGHADTLRTWRWGDHQVVTYGPLGSGRVTYHERPGDQAVAWPADLDADGRVDLWFGGEDGVQVYLSVE